MLRKKHSDINIKVPFKPYSPLKNKGPSPSPLQRPPNSNLSPMKPRTRSPHSRTHSQSTLQALSSTPNDRENNFQGLCQCLPSELSSRFHPNNCCLLPKSAFKTDLETETTSLSRLSQFSRRGGPQRTIKESKKVFTKCIEVMNSAKRRVEGEISHQTGGTDTTLKATMIAKENSRAHPPSFKALKIQMIQSVLPEDRHTSEKKCIGFQGTSGHEGAKWRREAIQEVQVGDFTPQENHQPIELINQSFSNAGGSELVRKAKLLQSVCQSQDSDYNDFDSLLRRVTMEQLEPRCTEMQSVLGSAQGRNANIILSSIFDL